MKKADFIVIGVVAVVVVALLIFLYGVNGGSGKFVEVEMNGEIVEILPLDKDAQRQYSTDDGGTNTLVISDGKASVTEADCPDGICKNHMPISRAGESIICLPHKLVITVVNSAEDDAEIDAVA